MRAGSRAQRHIGGLLFTAVIIVCLAAVEAVADDVPRGGGPTPSIGIDPAVLGGIFTPGAGNFIGPTITPPAAAYERPERVYVLPVLVAPADRGNWLPDVTTPGSDLDGAPFVAIHPHAVKYERAANNFSVHLQTARIMYRNMMRNPLNGKTRGTFELASWDASAGVARRVVAPSQRVNPLIMKLAGYELADVIALHQAQPLPTPYWVEQILDTLGCQRMSCPFVLAIAVVGNPFSPVHGAKWNYGFDNGGGAAYFNYTTVLDSWDTDPNGSHNFLSTLVHELGHAFGMPHSNDYCNVVPGCASEPRFDIDASASIMSYNLDNRIYGCPRASALDPTHCLLPGGRLIASLPGALEREDKRLLDTNTQTFPDFDYQPALDHPQPYDPVYRLDATGDWDITTSGSFYVESPDSHANTVRPPILIGGNSERFIDVQEENFLRTWVSSEGAFGSWAQYEIFFPEPITLERLRVYGGHNGNNDRPTGLQLFVAGDPNPIASAYNLFGANHDLVTQRTGSHFVLQMQRGASGLARLRGLRFFGKPVGSAQTKEFFGPAEPLATTGFGSTFGGSIENVVGSDQQIATASIPFVPGASWHSSARTPGTWVSVDVDLREERRLSGITVSSGHTGGVHRARQVQIERQCVCRAPYNGQGASCGAQSIARCDAAGGVGERVYEVVYWEPTPSLDHYVNFADTTARRWRIALKTADGPAGTDSWAVLRGLRFWTPGTGVTYEIFPPRGTVN